MTLLAIEVNDTGIMAAGGQPVRRLPVDGEYLESPGFALADRKQLLLGVAARRQAHRTPRLAFDAFWDRLNNEALPRSVLRVRTHAEIVHFHLQRIWEKVSPGVDEVVMAVPAHFGPHQLGILLSIADELSMPLKGFLALAVAAVRQIPASGPLLHLDIHLHRLEVTRLAVDGHISLQDSRWLEAKGWICLYRRWAECLAAEFVRATRFDPLHRGATEQALYDRLPALLDNIQKQGAAAFEMRSGQAIHRVTASRELLADSVDSVFSETRRLIDQLQDDRQDGARLTVQYTHRMGSLPGFGEMLAGMPDVRALQLPPGAAATGAIEFWRQLGNPERDRQALYFTSRSLDGIAHISESTPVPAASTGAGSPVTHVLYGDTAYLLSAAPLLIGSRPPPEGNALVLENVDGVLPQHCALRVENGEAVLEVYGDGQVRVAGRPVQGGCRLSLGQSLQIGTAGVSLRLITCRKAS